jgi:hypothetical protein
MDESLKETVSQIAPIIKRYATTKKLGIVAVLSEDVGGMTYVARWVRTDLLDDFPRDSSWADVTGAKS